MQDLMVSILIRTPKPHNYLYKCRAVHKKAINIHLSQLGHRNWYSLHRHQLHHHRSVHTLHNCHYLYTLMHSSNLPKLSQWINCRLLLVEYKQPPPNFPARFCWAGASLSAPDNCRHWQFVQTPVPLSMCRWSPHHCTGHRCRHQGYCLYNFTPVSIWPRQDLFQYPLQCHQNYLHKYHQAWLAVYLHYRERKPDPKKQQLAAEETNSPESSHNVSLFFPLRYTSSLTICQCETACKKISMSP